MAGRIRSIKPEILEDEEVGALSDAAWRLWVSMWLMADDFGNLRAAPAMLKGLVWWSDEHTKSTAEVDRLLAELVARRRIELYQVNGAPHAHIRNWEKHQRIDNAGRPRVQGPEHGNSNTCVEIRGESPRVSASRGSDLRSTTTTNDHDQRIPSPSVSGPRIAQGLSFDFEAVYTAYPRKIGRKRALQRFRQQVTTPENYAALTRAVANYAASVVGTEPRYVKHFDSFMASWEEWVDGEKCAPRPVKRVGMGDVRAPVAETREEKL
jgi:hypothetical protein